MIGINIKQVCSEWYDTVSDNEIDSVCILRKIIEVREGRAKCYIYNINDVEFIINDLSVKGKYQYMIHQMAEWHDPFRR